MPVLARELKGLVAGLAAGLGVVCAAYGVSAVATHGAALKQKPNEATAPTAANSSIGSAQLGASGRTLYSSLACVGCHGANAQGNLGPSLHHLGDPDAKIARNIASGYPGQMPAYKDQLSAAQIQTLVAYIQSLE